MWRRLDPSRTKKLSTSWVMILRLTGMGKVAHCGLVNFFTILITCINSYWLYFIFSYYYLLLMILFFRF